MSYSMLTRVQKSALRAAGFIIAAMLVLSFCTGTARAETSKVALEPSAQFTTADVAAPAATSITSIKAKGSTLVVKWKQAARATGYQVKAVSQADSSAKTVKVKGQKSLSVSLKNLEGNTKYSVKIRAYRTVNGITKYSSWSVAKSATTGAAVYSITYNLNGGKQAAGQRTSYKSSDKTFKLLSPTKKGYSFDGWYLSSKPTVKVTKIAKGTKGNLSLTAKWTSTHDYVIVEETAATCTEPGKKIETCTICGKTVETVLPAKGHKLVSQSMVWPTCTSSGMESHDKCTRCGKYFDEYDGSLVSYSSLIIPAEGHNFRVTSTTMATCTSSGRTTKTCSRCGRTDTTTTPALGHSYWTSSSSEATCTSSGYVTKMCSRCGRTDTSTTPALGHNYVSSSSVVDDGYVCSSGHKFKTPGEKIRRSGSSFVYVTCCPVCQGSYTQAHKTVTTTKCSRCGRTL